MIDSAAAAAIARFFDAPSEPRGRPFARTPSHSRRLGFGEKVHSREIGTMKPAIVPSKSKESRKKVFWGGVSVVVRLSFDIFFFPRRRAPFFWTHFTVFFPSPFTTRTPKKWEPAPPRLAWGSSRRQSRNSILQTLPSPQESFRSLLLLLPLLLLPLLPLRPPLLPLPLLLPREEAAGPRGPSPPPPPPLPALLRLRHSIRRRRTRARLCPPQGPPPWRKRGGKKRGPP